MARTMPTLLLGVLLLSAVQAQAQSYTRASLLKFIDDATAGLGQASNVLKEDKALQEAVLSQTTTPYAAPYPEMGQKVREMGTKVRSIKVNQGVLQGKRSQVDLLFGADEEVFSDDRRWRDVRAMIRQLQSRADLINADWEMVGILDKEFTGLVRKHGIKSRPSADLVKEMDSKKNGLWMRIEDAKKKNKNAKRWAEKGIAEPAAVEALAPLFADLESSWHPYKSEADRLKGSLKGKDRIYEGPGIPKVTVLESLEAASGPVKGKYEAFNKDHKVLEGKAKAALKEKQKKR